MSQKNEPLSPAILKKRRMAAPSTTCGIMSGDMKNATMASRPRKRYRLTASAAGRASTMAVQEATTPSLSENQNAEVSSRASRMASYQRSDRPSVGIEMKPLSVKE